MFDDARFLRGYLGECVAKELDVVEADVGDDTQDRCDDVGAVEPAPQAHLDNGEIDLLLSKVLKSKSRSKFEEGIAPLQFSTKERGFESCNELNRLRVSYFPL